MKNIFVKVILEITNNQKLQFILFLSVLISMSLLMIYIYGDTIIGHDFHFHENRFLALMQSLKDGSYPFYIDYKAINNYGYLSRIFYPDLLLLPFAYLALFTDYIFAYKVMLFVLTISCGLTTYYLVKAISQKRYIAYLSSVLYAFSYYRLLDIYRRAAIGEVIAISFIPLTFLGLHYLIKGDIKKWYILAIGFVLILYSHMITSILIAIGIVIILCLNYRRFINDKYRIKYIFYTGLVVLLLSSFYIFPLIEQLLSNKFYFQTKLISSMSDFKGFSFLEIIWGYFTGLTLPKQMIFIVGCGIILTLLLMLRFFIHDKDKNLKVADNFVIVGTILVLLTSSWFPWHWFPFLNFIQFPWRFFMFISLFYAIAGSYYVYYLVKTPQRKIIVFSFLVFLSLIMIKNEAIDTLQKQYEYDLAFGRKGTVENSYNQIGLEYLPEKVPSVAYIAARSDSVKSIYEDTKIKDFSMDNGIITFCFSSEKLEKLELPLIYYKGYTAISNDKEISVSESQNGLVQLSVNNSASVKVFYGETILQKVSWYITIVSIFVLCIYIFIQRKRKLF